MQVRTRSFRWLHLAGIWFAGALLALLLCSSLRAQERQNLLTFVQITDAHLFDDKDDTDDDNRKALEWVDETISTLQKSGVNIDFVAYTGDVGLANVSTDPKDKSCLANASVSAAAAQKATLYCLEGAVDEAVRQISKIPVKRILFVTGNNDVAGEHLDCLPNYAGFMAAVQKRLTANELEVLDARKPISIKGVEIVGIASESMKRSDRYESLCTRDPASPQCPASQFAAFRKVVDGGGPTLVFTHMPYLNDPFRCVGWQLDPASRLAWESAATRVNVIGIFAGHFHSADQSIYGSNVGSMRLALPTGGEIAKKTWVAPPIAVKNQASYRPQARGFLLVMINLKTGEVRAEPYWYVTDLPRAKALPSPPQCWFNEEELGLNLPRTQAERPCPVAP